MAIVYIAHKKNDVFTPNLDINPVFILTEFLHTTMHQRVYINYAAHQEI